MIGFECLKINVVRKELVVSNFDHFSTTISQLKLFIDEKKCGTCETFSMIYYYVRRPMDPKYKYSSIYLPQLLPKFVTQRQLIKIHMHLRYKIFTKIKGGIDRLIFCRFCTMKNTFSTLDHSLFHLWFESTIKECQICAEYVSAGLLCMVLEHWNKN